MTALARRQRAQTKREAEAELGRRARAKLKALRADVAAARKLRTVRLREVGANCRAQRKLISERAKRARARLNASIARTRERAKGVCSASRGDAIATTLERIERAAKALEGELREQSTLRIWAKPARSSSSSSSSSGRGRRERAEESDDAVASNIDDPGLRIVWAAVKHRIKAGRHRSRTEAFFEWAAEHPAQVYEIQEADAVRHLAELERQERQLAGALRKGSTKRLRAELDAFPPLEAVPF